MWVVPLQTCLAATWLTSVQQWKQGRCVLSSTGYGLFADEVGISSLINPDYRLLLDPLLEKTRLLSCGFNPLRTSHLHWVILGGRVGESSHQNTSLLHHLSAMALLWSYCSWAIYSHVLALSKEVQRGSSACASLRGAAGTEPKGSRATRWSRTAPAVLQGRGVRGAVRAPSGGRCSALQLLCCIPPSLNAFTLLCFSKGKNRIGEGLTLV